MDVLFLLFLFFLGLCIGSFLGVVIYRLPRGESVSVGRSYCEFCKRKLTFIDLIPLFSFLSLGGKCRYCHKGLSYFYPVIELMTGILFVLFALNNNSSYEVYNISYTIEILYYLFILAVLLVIFFIDLKHGIIPFPIVFPAILVSFFYQLIAHQDVLINHLISAAGAMLFFLLIFLLTRGRGMGFGDVVYALLMGLLLGFPQIILGLYIAFLSGAVISLILIARKKKKMKGGTVPFGPFLVAGTLICLFWGQPLIDMVMVYLTK